jgi:acyl-coenzyme A synthetase/AMP-(fatty) acid ligase
MSRRLQRGNFSLIGTLVAIALTIGLVVVFVFGGFGKKADNKRADKVGETIVGQSMARAKDGKCIENLRQVRMAIEMAKTSDDVPPAGLNELKMPAEMLVDPIGKEPYEYDPATGTVKCVHPGHEKY